MLAVSVAVAAILTLGMTFAITSRRSTPTVTKAEPEPQAKAPVLAELSAPPALPAPVEAAPAPEVAEEPAAPMPPVTRPEEQEKEIAEPAPTEKEEPAEATAEPVGPPPRPPLVIKRRCFRSDEELRRELILMPEMNLEMIPKVSRRALAEGRRLSHEEKLDFGGLPIRIDVDCQLPKKYAENLHTLARKLRAYMAVASQQDSIDIRINPAVLRKYLVEGESVQGQYDDATSRAVNLSGVNPGEELRDGVWRQKEAVPTLTQMLVPEGRLVRRLLVDLLARIPDSRATAALAQRALYDFAPDVRAAALEALRDRRREDFEPVLLAGLRYPWPPVADHAAEALVALENKKVVPRLVALLREPDPGGVFVDSRGRPSVRGLVRISHLANCQLCHASSSDVADQVRGRIPSPSRPLPPLTKYYSHDVVFGMDVAFGNFVRADVTYLYQDFSVPQPVDKPGPWPTSQRYDYVVRIRPATREEQREFKRDGPRIRYPQRESVLFALRELTGQDVGKASRDWEKLIGKKR
jgi:hypothetical protein